MQARRWSLSWPSQRYLKADALGWKDLRPIFDELFVGSAHRSDVAIEVVQSDWIEAAVLFAERGIPIDLIGQ